jgi:hypothetical protein
MTMADGIMVGGHATAWRERLGHGVNHSAGASRSV